MSSATPTSCWPIDLYPMGLLAAKTSGRPNLIPNG
jgi:hypothetical protein